MTTGGGFGSEVDELFVEVVGGLNEKSFRQIEKEVAEAGERAGKQGGGRMGTAMQGMIAGASAGLVGIAAQAAAQVGAALLQGLSAPVKLAAEAQDNVRMFQAQLGATADEAEMLGRVAENVFKNNFGGSLTEAAEFVKNVRREFKGLSEQELTNVTNSSAAIADNFQEDQGKVAQAIKATMQATGATAQEATDLIAAGFQKGLNKSGDFLDSLLEYGPQFEKAKATSGQLFSILETGLGSGVLGVDKISDTFKEFGFSLSDTSKGMVAAFDDLGIKQADLTKKIDSGALTQTDAFQLVIEKIKGVKSETERMAIISQIFKGAGEDLGAVISKIDLAKTKTGDLTGATESLNVKYASFGQIAASLGREVQVALLPVGKQVLELANGALPAVKSAISQVGPVVTEVARFLVEGFTKGKRIAGQFAQEFGPQIQRAVAAFQPAVQAIGPLFSAVFGLVRTLWETVLRPVLTAISPLVTGLVATIGNTLSLLVNVVTGVANAISALLRGDVGGAVKALEGIFQSGVAFVVRQVRNLGSTVLGLIQQLVPQMQKVAGDVIRGLIIGIENGAGAVVKAAKELAGNIISGVSDKLLRRSPSKVMIDIGQDVGAGLVIGMDKTAPDVQRAAAHLGSKVREGVIETLSQGLVDIENSVKASEIVRSLFGSGEAGLAAALKYYGVTTFDELSQKAGGAAQVIGAAYSGVIERQKALAQSSEEAMQALSALNDAQITSANAAAQRDPQGFTDSAYRKTFGADDEGLIRSLAATTGRTVDQIRANVDDALADAQKFAPEVAAVIARVWAASLATRREVAAEETRITARAVEMANDRRAQIVENLQAEQAAADDALITVDYLTGQLAELAAQGLDAKNNGFVDYLTDLSKGTGQAAAAAQVLLDNFDAFWTRAQFRAAQPDALSDTPAPALGARPGTAAPEPAPARPAGPPNTAVDAAQNREALSAEAQAWKTRTEAQIEATRRQEEYRVTLKGLDIDQLKAAQAKALELGQMEKYAVLQEEILRLTKEQTEAGQKKAEADKKAAEEAAKRAALELNDTNVSGRFEKGKTEASDKAASTILNTVEAIGSLANPATFLAFVLEKLNIVGTIFEGLLSVIAAPLAALQEPLRLIGEIVGALIAPNLQLLALVLTPVVRVIVAVYDALANLLKSITFGLVDITRDKYKQNSAALAPAPAAPSTTAPATASGNNVVQIPTSQVTVIASPEWEARFGGHVDRFGGYVQTLVTQGMVVRVEPQRGGGNSGPAGNSLAWDLT